MKSKESKAGKKAASTRPNENHLRVNFLHHAAQLLFSQRSFPAKMGQMSSQMILSLVMCEGTRILVGYAMPQLASQSGWKILTCYTAVLHFIAQILVDTKIFLFIFGHTSTKAATLRCCKCSGVGRGDALSKLGSTYIRHMNNVCLMEHIKVDREIGRTLCAKCKRVFVSNPDSNCHPIRMRLNKKKQVVRTCLDCGTIRRFTINRNYLSRNEKTQLEMTSCGSREAID
uniref:Uncharacterized protein n=1 Tax=Parascaris equorum TaxID=6256 RepID=A0A914RUT5_PAREQ